MSGPYFYFYLSKCLDEDLSYAKHNKKGFENYHQPYNELNVKFADVKRGLGFTNAYMFNYLQELDKGSCEEELKIYMQNLKDINYKIIKDLVEINTICCRTIKMLEKEKGYENPQCELPF